MSQLRAKRELYILPVGRRNILETWCNILEKLPSPLEVRLGHRGIFMDAKAKLSGLKLELAAYRTFANRDRFSGVVDETLMSIYQV